MKTILGTYRAKRIGTFNLGKVTLNGNYTPSFFNSGYGTDIGRESTSAGGSSRYLTGKIINPQIYNRALSDIEIQQLFYSQYIN